MTSENSASDALDPRINLIVSSMYTNPGSLSGKLKAIWMMAIDLCFEAETKHRKRLAEFLGESSALVFEFKSICEKSLQFKKFHKKPEDSLIQAYAGLLKTVANIEENSHHIKTASTPATSATSDSDLINSLLTRENFGSMFFLDKIVPYFFALQLHCFTLLRMLDSPRGIPADPIARRKRSSKGGDARTVGEDILKSYFLKFIATRNNERKFHSIKEFFHQCEAELENILTTYRTDHIGKRDKNSGKIIIYGKEFTTESLDRIFRKWRNDDPVFRAKWADLLRK